VALEADPTGIVATWWPIIGVLLPLIVAAATKAGAAAHVHKAVAVGFAVVAAVVTALDQDWSTVTATLIATRIVVLWGVSETTYLLVDGLIKGSQGTRGLNDLRGLAPGRGIG
jgi:hypothetical protein